ncbi:hypothetical protein [Psychrobacter vallis]|uniref:hypothetical protein n=1 Tax=Psychrobacter vallis TaxID=248451 RepID=UPI001919FDF3|nr:hypothetical protein [Psychrobacter vallis]
MNIDDLDGLDEVTRKEVEELLKVTREKNRGEVFAQTQFKIYDCLLSVQKYDLALDVLENMKESDDKGYYELAQMNIAVVKYYFKDKVDEAYEIIIELFNRKSWVTTIISEYAFKFAKDYLKKKEYEKSIKLFRLVSDTYLYETYCYEKINSFLLDPENETLGKNFIELLDQTLLIVDILKLDFSQLSDTEKAPERKLAHYTGTYTTEKLLAVDKDQGRPSAFRLNTINNVNDPSEGQLLSNHLKGVKENSFYAPDFDEKLHAFISCFTFNHDSLNQFRLYGKQDNKEASGISLVFNQNFFQEHSSTAGLSYVAFKDNLQKNDTIPIHKSTIESPKEKIFEKPVERIKEQPVMRCVYLDPTSNYVHLAQRNRLTFFREFSDETIDIENEKTSKAEAEWKAYKNYIDKKTKDFKDAFYSLKNIYKSIVKENTRISDCDSRLSNDIEKLLDEILLPLKYLIKHSAFQEEQECRMIYITSLEDPKVKIDFGKFLYIEYEADVRDNLDKIYIAPAATQYQPYLAKLLCKSQNKHKVRIDLSNNPYRQT